MVVSAIDIDIDTIGYLVESATPTPHLMESQQPLSAPEAPRTTSPKFHRQVTDYATLIGCPAADAKLKQNNIINRLHPGDDGYLPLSGELCIHGFVK